MERIYVDTTVEEKAIAYPTDRTNRPTVPARFNVNDQSFRAANQHDADGAINERLETFDLVQ